MYVSVSVRVKNRYSVVDVIFCFFFFQAEDGIRDLVRSRGLGDVYKRQSKIMSGISLTNFFDSLYITSGASYSVQNTLRLSGSAGVVVDGALTCLLYTSDAADERSSVDLGGRRIIKKQKKE